jgi:hypothetical protein
LFQSYGIAHPSFVVTGLVPVTPLRWAILAPGISEMAGTSPAMTTSFAAIKAEFLSVYDIRAVPK